VCSSLGAFPHNECNTKALRDPHPPAQSLHMDMVESSCWHDIEPTITPLRTRGCHEQALATHSRRTYHLKQRASTLGGCHTTGTFGLLVYWWAQRKCSSHHPVLGVQRSWRRGRASPHSEPCQRTWVNSGAAIIAIGHGGHTLNDRGYSYLVILGAMMFSTIATQDMPDMPGDATRGRKTLPLVYGHVVARWVIAIPILFWSLICPAFLDTDISGYVFSLLLGSIFAFHLLAFRTNAADKVSWKLWSTLFSLPLFKNHEVFVQAWKTNFRSLG
jgi:hypothetical protein